VRLRLPAAFEDLAASRLTQESDRLAARWLARLAPEATVANEALSQAAVELMEPIAAFVGQADPAVFERPCARSRIRAYAALRLELGARPRELARDLELLATELDSSCREWIGHPAPSPEAVLRVVGRLNRAPLLIGNQILEAFAPAEWISRRELSRQIREFSDTLGHELNNPLGAAETAAGLLEQDDLAGSSQERRRLAALIQRSLRRARLVAQDVRDLALAQAAHARSGRWMPLAEVIPEVLSHSEAALAAARSRVEVQGPVPPITVEASRVEIALLNLVHNAIKYSDPARGERWIRVHFEPGADWWWICVSDNGLGIPAERQRHIFARHVRAHPEVADGDGLGLAIVRQVVQQLGGELELDSQPGRGSTFRFSLRDRPQ